MYTYQHKYNMKTYIDKNEFKIITQIILKISTYESKLSCLFAVVIILDVLLLEPAFNLPIFMCIRPIVV